MRLKKIHLQNFRGYQDKVTIDIDRNITGIIGKNDFGKSTILEALAIFFEIDGFKSDKNDLNCFKKSQGEDFFEISCEFDQFPNEIIIDETNKTSLENEFLLNKKSLFQISKKFKGSSGKIEETVIICQHPDNEEIKNLLALKISELKTLGKSLGIEKKVSDQRISSLWRKEIRDEILSRDNELKLKETRINIDKEFSIDSKNLWKKIEILLPTFALFRADRESSDIDPEAKNPLQQAVKDAQDALKDKIDALEAEIQKNVLDVAERTLSKLQEMAPELANELKPQFREKPKWTFNFTLDGDNGIPINKRGSGVRRLILLNFFRAEAEKSALVTNRNIIYAIEEPETSQHPNYQIMLMKALLSLSQQENRQIIVTTHVPALAGLIPVESIRYVTKNQSNSPVIKTLHTDADTIINEVAESLGVLPPLGAECAKAVVLVEGKSDVTFFSHASEALRDAGHISKSFADLGIVIIPVGGCGNIKYWVTLKQLDTLQLEWCVFLDSDIGGTPEQVRIINKRKEEVEAIGRKFFSTRKREIENYILPEVVQRISQKAVQYTDKCDAKKIIAKAVCMKEDDVFDKFWPQMTADEIISSSSYSENSKNFIEIIITINEIAKCLQLDN